jgi:hypothetical protein
MAEYRNVSSVTVTDFTTGQHADPDEVINVPDELRATYENHPIWKEVGAYVAPVAAPSFVAPVVPVAAPPAPSFVAPVTPVVEPVEEVPVVTPVVAPVVDAPTQEVI